MFGAESWLEEVASALGLEALEDLNVTGDDLLRGFHFHGLFQGGYHASSGFRVFDRPLNRCCFFRRSRV